MSQLTTFDSHSLTKSGWKIFKMEFRSKLKVQISIENLLFSVVSVFEGVTKTKVEIIPIKVSSDKSLCYYKFC